MATASLLKTVTLNLNNLNWVSQSDWACVGAVTKRYFKAQSRLIFIDTQNPQFHAIMFQDQPVYIFNDWEKVDSAYSCISQTPYLF